MKISKKNRVLAAGAAAIGFTLFAIPARSEPLSTQRVSLEKEANILFSNIFPTNVSLNSSGYIELSESNRKKYTTHFELPDNASWNVIQREAIERILERANQVQ